MDAEVALRNMYRNGHILFLVVKSIDEFSGKVTHAMKAFVDAESYRGLAEKKYDRVKEERYIPEKLLVIKLLLDALKCNGQIETRRKHRLQPFIIWFKTEFIRTKNTQNRTES
ncbi:hypothetical protein GLOIN_2v1630913 [Rhizophagus irregularis DAOM 181602=DAOM 197198]|nr:hypothetical protein GLOIN_2v1630913 [Rhizophagus irregularis DAOM 181602=DAOM 197198]CAG8716112.1 770_t:CDS:2 [Rhizophagus irregularis]